MSNFSCLVLFFVNTVKPLLTGPSQVMSTQRRFPPKYDENTFQAIQSTFRSLEMHSRRPYKIFICSVIPGELPCEQWFLVAQRPAWRNHCSQGTGELFEITRLQHSFSEKFRCNVKFYESENFSDSSLHPYLESENFRFLLSKKNSATWVVKCKKNKTSENRREFI